MTVYDDVPTTAYMTTFMGYSREVPLQLQANIFRLLDRDYSSRHAWTMQRDPLPKGALLSIREDLTEDSDFFEDVMLTSKMHYTLMGLSSDTEGHTYNLARGRMSPTTPIALVTTGLKIKSARCPSSISLTASPAYRNLAMPC